ncbi:MAG: hypothetical protein Q9166_005137 [cf. Caloplaca sp. 2 TL-2023]
MAQLPSSNHTSAPTLQVNGLTPISESASSSPSTAAPSDRSAMRLNMLRKIRPPPFRHAWAFYHEKGSPSADVSAPYEERLTTMLENIITIKTFWELLNQFPLQSLKMRDSIHFFKRTVRPVWEDPRNVHGGSWTFRVNKEKSAEFWKEVLLLAVGEQFSDAIQQGMSHLARLLATSLDEAFADAHDAGDDICGLTLSRRFNADLISIWNRRTNNQASIDGIRDVVLAQLSDELKPKEGTFYYKPHSEHKGFDEVVAAMKKESDEGKMESAKVEDREAEKVMMKEAEEEGIHVPGIEKSE